MMRKYANKLDDDFRQNSFALSMDIQSDSKPTKPLLHKEARFLIIISGQGKIKINNTDYTMKAGHIIALLPFEVSEIVEITEKVTYYLLVYNFDRIKFLMKDYLNIDKESFDLFNYLENNPCKKISPKGRYQVKQILTDLREEVGLISTHTNQLFHDHQDLSTIRSLLKLAEFIILYQRENQQISNYTPSYKEIFAYLFYNASKSLHLDEVANIFFLDSQSLEAGIQAYVGISFKEVLQRIRVFKWLHLQENTELNQEEISLLLNYSFSQEIQEDSKKIQHLTPAECEAYWQLVEVISPIAIKELQPKILEFTFWHFTDALTIEHLSQKFSLSPQDINSQLIAYTERNFQNLVTHLRIKSVCQHLQAGDKDLKEIAKETGFIHENKLKRSFYTLMQMTPKAYWEKYKQEKSSS
ncbi:helix-turn-helix transcriptional regulator [Aerococcus loyolae]|nr:helix-turn-helix transcriptional regulator [Aerococcus loyolae]KAA9266856.1 helix-turn-helix transcriptional regulator [Aerococcus loyolae]